MSGGDLAPIDPTANVLALVAAEQKRQDDLRAAEGRRQDNLRDLATHWRDKLDDLERQHQREIQLHEQAANLARAGAEQGRINALLDANTNNVALALSKQGDQALAQDKRIATLEQNQYSGAGGAAATDKARDRTSITRNELIGAGIFLLAALTYLHSVHLI